ncbi:MAG: hypothetical protein NTW29_18640 [Bacteroidetes bacterium]|nr:hypothetical protein [Bacteroidota bacterium]
MLKPSPHAYSFPGNDEMYWKNHPEELPSLVIKPVERFPGHGNRKDNTNPHIVYTFTFIPPPGDTRTPVLKYGIADELTGGMSRPQSQLEGLRSKYGITVTYTFMRVLNRATALAMEQQLTDRHYDNYKENPRAQILPKPTQIKKGF